MSVKKTAKEIGDRGKEKYGEYWRGDVVGGRQVVVYGVTNDRVENVVIGIICSLVVLLTSLMTYRQVRRARN